MRYGQLIAAISEAVKQHRLAEPFSADELNSVLGIDFAGVFLPKHRIGNPGNNTPLFVRVKERPALYRLNREYTWRLNL